MITVSALSAPGAMVRFLSELHATGAPVIHLRGRSEGLGALEQIEAEADGDPELHRLLGSWHQEAALDIGGPALSFDETAARRGACLLFRTAWCYLNRDTGREEVARLLLDPAAHPGDSATAQFSADLTLQHLPAVLRMAQALSPGDPLLSALRSLARLFPLSGVNIHPEKPPTQEMPPAATWGNLQSHSGLRQLFLDRILITRAGHWLDHPETSLAIRHSLGEHRQTLAPAFGSAAAALTLPSGDSL
ncbi:MAG: hypothetical protein JWM59_4036 [Verrucomicrobiales bacterium]|nr:hypothetical protein [Verrucomicrobiales bacterium]